MITEVMSGQYFKSVPCMMHKIYLMCVSQVHTQKKKSGVISPKKFVLRVKRDNEQFCNYMHQVISSTREFCIQISVVRVTIYALVFAHGLDVNPTNILREYFG